MQNLTTVPICCYLYSQFLKIKTFLNYKDKLVYGVEENNNS